MKLGAATQGEILFVGHRMRDVEEDEEKVREWGDDRQDYELLWEHVMYYCNTHAEVGYVWVDICCLPETERVMTKDERFEELQGKYAPVFFFIDQALFLPAPLDQGKLYKARQGGRLHSTYDINDFSTRAWCNFEVAVCLLLSIPARLETLPGKYVLIKNNRQLQGILYDFLEEKGEKTIDVKAEKHKGYRHHSVNPAFYGGRRKLNPESKPRVEPITILSLILEATRRWSTTVVVSDGTLENFHLTSDEASETFPMLLQNLGAASVQDDLPWLVNLLILICYHILHILEPGGMEDVMPRINSLGKYEFELLGREDRLEIHDYAGLIDIDEESKGNVEERKEGASLSGKHILTLLNPALDEQYRLTPSALETKPFDMKRFLNEAELSSDRRLSLRLDMNSDFVLISAMQAFKAFRAHVGQLGLAFTGLKWEDITMLAEHLSESDDVDDFTSMTTGEVENTSVKLSHLDLSWNDLFGARLIRLTSPLRHNHHLRILHLSYCNIGNDLHCLASIFEGGTLEELYLRGNKIFSGQFEGLWTALVSSASKQFRVLDVSQNSLSIDACSLVRDSFNATVADKLDSPLAYLSTLELSGSLSLENASNFLSFSFNLFTEHGRRCDALRDLLKLIRTGLKEGIIRLATLKLSKNCRHEF